MSIEAELGQYILQTNNKKNYEDSMGGGGWNPLTSPSGYASGYSCSYS